MAYCEILGIEPGADKKTIKIAYARLLKQTRPDRDPEGFKRLHRAYQDALNQLGSSRATSSYKERLQQKESNAENKIQTTTAKQNISESSIEVQLPDTSVNAPLADPDVVATINNDLLIETDDNTKEQASDPGLTIDQLQHDWNTLFQQVNNLINSPIDRSLVQQWQFIESIPSLFDFEFKSNVSRELFQLISQENLASETKQDQIPTPVLNYLDQLFNWEGQWIQYEKQFSDASLEAVYPYITHTRIKSDKSKTILIFKAERLHLFRRTIAFFIDLAITALLLKVFKVNSDIAIIAFSTIYFFISIPLLESSPWQASFGKKVMGLQVVTQCGNRLSFTTSFWRSFLFLGGLCGTVITLILHIIIIYKHNMLTHDLSSLSYVIRK